MLSTGTPTPPPALETQYMGITFRSRTEARIAVFLEELGADWEYEPQGFCLPNNGNYLPDFWVSNFPIEYFSGAGKVKRGFWLEVKGAERTLAELSKLRELCYETDAYGYFAYYKDLKEILKESSRQNVAFFGGNFSIGCFRNVCVPLRRLDTLKHHDGDWKSACALFDELGGYSDYKNIQAMNKLLDSAPFHGEFNSAIWLDAARAALAERFGT